MLETKEELFEQKNQLLFGKLNEYIGKPLTVGYIGTCNDNVTNTKELTSIMQGIKNKKGKIYLSIEKGIIMYSDVSFIGKDLSIVYIKDENNKLLYNNSKVLERCPVPYNMTDIAKLVKATFGEKVANDYCNGITEYYRVVRDTLDGATAKHKKPRKRS